MTDAQQEEFLRDLEARLCEMDIRNMALPSPSQSMLRMANMARALVGPILNIVQESEPVPIDPVDIHSSDSTVSVSVVGSNALDLSIAASLSQYATKLYVDTQVSNEAATRSSADAALDAAKFDKSSIDTTMPETPSNDRVASTLLMKQYVDSHAGSTVVYHDDTLDGDGTEMTPLKIIPIPVSYIEALPETM